MRKLMLSLLLMMAAMGAKAQFEKGTTYVAASTTSLGLSYSSSEKLNFGLDFTGGYFVQSAWMLYGKLGYDHTRYTDHFVIISRRTAFIWALVCSMSMPPRA